MRMRSGEAAEGRGGLVLVGLVGDGVGPARPVVAIARSASAKVSTSAFVEPRPRLMRAAPGSRS